MRPEATSFGAAMVDRQRQPGRAGWLLLSPVIAWAVAFVIAPAVIMLVYSFAHRGTLGGVILGFTLENYASVLDPVYLQIVIRSIVYAGITTVLVSGRRLSGGLPDRPRRSALAQPAADGGDGAVLDQLPDPHLRVGDDPQERGPAQLAADPAAS